MDNISLLSSINEIYNEELESKINYENHIEDMDLEQLLETYCQDILNETVSEEKLEKIRAKAGKKISRVIGQSLTDYKDLKLQILTNNKEIVKYIARLAAAGGIGGAYSAATTVARLGAEYGSAGVVTGLKAGAAGTAIGLAIVIGGAAIYTLIQKKRYDQLCVIKLIGTKTTKNGLKKEKVIGIWLTIRISRNDLAPEVKSKVKFI